MPPPVLPAQPPQNISSIRIHLQYSGQSVKSTVPKPVVLSRVPTLKKAWCSASPKLPKILRVPRLSSSALPKMMPRYQCSSSLFSASFQWPMRIRK